MFSQVTSCSSQKTFSKLFSLRQKFSDEVTRGPLLSDCGLLEKVIELKIFVECVQGKGEPGDLSKKVCVLIQGIE